MPRVARPVSSLPRSLFLLLSVVHPSFAWTMAVMLGGAICNAESLPAPSVPVWSHTKGVAFLTEWPRVHLEGSLPEEVTSGLDQGTSRASSMSLSPSITETSGLNP